MKPRMMALLTLALLLTSCGTPFLTPRDALHDDYGAGILYNPIVYVAGSEEVLQEQAVAGGQVLLYRWTAPQSKAGEYCVGVTFVTPVQTLRGQSWRAQASNWLNKLGECYTTFNEFIAEYTPYIGQTTAFGVSGAGKHVRISWSDGQVNVVELQDGTFLLARPEDLQVTQFELLDANNNVLAVKK